MKEADIPSAAQRIQELEQGSRTLGELEPAKALAFDALRVPPNHADGLRDLSRRNAFGFQASQGLEIGLGRAEWQSN